MARMGKGQSSTELTQVEKSRGFCRSGCGGERHRRSHRAGMGGRDAQDPTGLVMSGRGAGAEDFTGL